VVQDRSPSWLSGADRWPSWLSSAAVPLSRALPIVAIWGVIAVCLSRLTVRVRDWFVMTNELLYERRAISVVRDSSPLPRLHGELIPSFDQLYPLLVAPAFRHGTVAHDLADAHVLNAWIMSSACIPAFLLARRVLPLWAAYVAAVAAVCVPWILYASFLLTEVAAYPVFLWALLAMHGATSTPSQRRDLLALVAIALAFLARTQLALLALVLPVAIVAFEAGRAPAGAARTRAAEGARRAFRAHRLLAYVYAGGLAVAVALLAAGNLSSSLGVYGDTISGNLLPAGTPRAFVEHLATFSLGLGILPFVVGVAWLLAGLVRPAARPEVHAFACVGALAFVAVMVEVTIFDVRFGGAGGFVHDRYLFYLAPVVIVGFLCALVDVRRPRWSLVAPTVCVALGFAIGLLPRFTWQQFATLNSDTPVSALYRPIVHNAYSLSGARIVLVLATIVLATLFVMGSTLLRPSYLTAVMVAFLFVVMPAVTAYVFVRLFGQPDWASRPLTNPQPGGFEWLDASVGGNANVTIVPYPVSTAYLVNQRVWRDYEFWNKSVDRVVQYSGPDGFRFTGDTFPKLHLRFDPRTGASSKSPTRYVLQAAQESRFRISGPIRVSRAGVQLIDAGRTWRTEWLSSGLTDDGWTRPGVTARVRVFAAPGQRRNEIRFLTFGVRPGGVDGQPVSIVSNAQTRRGIGIPGGKTSFETIRVCVPPRGFGEVRLSTPVTSWIPGDLGDLSTSEVERRGGVFLSEIALADEIGDTCGAADR
jgi:hypothetical protein